MSRLLRLIVFLSTLASLSSNCSSSSTTSCNSDKLQVALQPLRANANYSSCQVDASAAAICASSACKALMAPLAALNLPICQVTLKGISFNTFALKSLASSSCQQSTKQSQTPSPSNLMRTILRLMN